MVTITFPDRETEKRALAFLLGRFSGRVLRSGEHLVPEAAPEALADRNIPFTVKGKTTYEQQVPGMRSPQPTVARTVRKSTMRTQVVRTEVERLLHQVPFRPFILSLENGDRVVIGHPENIAFDPGPEGSQDFYVLAGRLRLFSTFEAVSSVSLVETVEGGGRNGGAA